MSRHNRRRPEDGGELRAPTSVGERREPWRGVEHVVRGVTSAGAAKAYRCPGCDQLIRVGAPHVVAWPADDPDAGDRRHWHTACWAARDHRAPGVQRGRSAPRF